MGTCCTTIERVNKNERDLKNYSSKYPSTDELAQDCSRSPEELKGFPQREGSLKKAIILTPILLSSLGDLDEIQMADELEAPNSPKREKLEGKSPKRDNAQACRHPRSSDSILKKSKTFKNPSKAMTSPELENDCSMVNLNNYIFNDSNINEGLKTGDRFKKSPAKGFQRAEKSMPSNPSLSYKSKSTLFKTEDVLLGDSFSLYERNVFFSA